MRRRGDKIAMICDTVLLTDALVALSQVVIIKLLLPGSRGRFTSRRNHNVDVISITPTVVQLRVRAALAIALTQVTATESTRIAVPDVWV